MNQQKAKRDIFLMLFFIAASLVLIFWLIPGYITVTKLMEQEAFTPRTYPNLIAYGLLMVSVLGLINSISNYVRCVREEGKQKPVKKTVAEWKEKLFPYFIYLLIIVYVVIYRTFGIIPATVIVPPVMLWVLNCRSWKGYAGFYVFATAIYLIFTKLLSVPIK